MADISQTTQPNASPADPTPETGGKAESLIFAKIVRYLAEQSTPSADDTPSDALPPEPDPSTGQEAAQLFIEIAEAFENTQGFEYSADQAGPLAGVMGTLAVGMRTLADQARQGGHDNAAAKMEWAAGRARTFTARLEESHLGKENGIIAFLDDDSNET